MPTNPNRPLTARQQEVLAVWLSGATYRELATQLGISHSTVNPHLKGIARKLGAQGIARETLREASRTAPGC
jgi:protein AroM